MLEDFTPYALSDRTLNWPLAQHALKREASGEREGVDKCGIFHPSILSSVGVQATGPTSWRLIIERVLVGCWQGVVVRRL